MVYFSQFWTLLIRSKLSQLWEVERTIVGTDSNAKRKGKRMARWKLKPSSVEVLVVDDEHGVRHLLTEALTADGYTVYLTDGAKAVAALKAQQYDLIIADIRMPVMDGLELLALASRESPNAKFIIITGYPSEETLKLSLEMGAARYLVKPFELGELRKAVKNVLRGKSPRVYGGTAEVAKSAVPGS